MQFVMLMASGLRAGGAGFKAEAEVDILDKVKGLRSTQEATGCRNLLSWVYVFVLECICVCYILYACVCVCVCVIVDGCPSI